jgi:phosphatidate cytidylyltransferase
MDPIMKKTDWSNLRRRAVSGFFFALFTLGCVWLHEISFILAFGFFMLGSLYEFYSLYGIKKSPFFVLGILSGTALFATSALSLLGYFDFRYLLWLLIPFLLSVLSATFSHNQRSFEELGIMLLGIAYSAFPFVAILFCGIHAPGAEYDFFPVLCFIVLVWANDSFAYLFGKFLGRNKLAETISPGKTWEGTLGGAVGSGLIALAILVFSNPNRLSDIAVIWICASFLAVVGDLSESKLKRTLHVKNSGNFLPGHGGFLDRFDSFLISAPVLMIYFVLIKA